MHLNLLMAQGGMEVSRMHASLCFNDPEGFPALREKESDLRNHPESPPKR